MWTNSKALSVVSLSVYFESDEMTGYSSIDNFLSFNADGLQIEDWKKQLNWFNPKLCTAAVLNFKADETLAEFMRQNGNLVYK